MSPRLRSLLPVVSSVLLAAAGWAASASPEGGDFMRAWSSISGEGLARHIEVLAADDFEGREPGTEGERKTLAYLESAFRAAGAEPGWHDTFLQPVPLVEITRDRAPSFAVSGAGRPGRFTHETDFTASAGGPRAEIALAGVPIVFAGLGLTAPEYGWDDYASADVRGAAVMLLRGEPPASDTSVFQGRALTVHGLPGTKYENAARRGARAAIVVHTDATAGFPWSVMTGGGTGRTQNFLADSAGPPRLELVVHVNEPAARRLLAAAGLDLDTLIARAGRRGFRAIPTPLAAAARWRGTSRPITSHNVIAKVRGREAPDECVIYTGHWDHVGTNPALTGDTIFNGAVDNATGTAALLELARAFASLPSPPRRTVYFVATTAEEKGLLGAEHLATHPVAPLERTAAVLNLDALFPFGAFDAMTVTGFGASEIEDDLAVAAARLGRVLQDDSSPEAGAYYRSDHYPFAKRGVPALFAVGNPRFDRTPPDTAQLARFERYLAGGYHKPADEYDPATWDLAGIEGDVRAYFETGYRIAHDRRFPNWRYGNEFRALRDAMRAR